MLILIGGPDRVGKSTLAAQLSELTRIPVKHHSTPNPTDESIFDVYRRNIAEDGDQIWDRSYLCAYILERFRKRTHDHLSDIVDLELELRKKHEIIHVGVVRPWSWSAPLHYKELRETHPLHSEWVTRDRLIARQNEHHFYQEEMDNFYRYVTMFPSFMVEQEWPPQTVWANVQSIVNSDRPRFTTK